MPSVCKKCIAVRKVATPLRELTCHTVLPATRQRWHSRPYPGRSWYSIKRPRRDARLSWPGTVLNDARRAGPSTTAGVCVQGPCTYILSRHVGGEFVVHSQNVQCGYGGVTCTKAINSQPFPSHCIMPSVLCLGTRKGVRSVKLNGGVLAWYHTIRYDTIRDVILACARKPTWVSLTYRTETTTKKCRTEKVKSINGCSQKYRSGESVESVRKKKKEGYGGKICRRGRF